MDKKEKIKALEKHFGVIAKYLGVPSCAYEIRTIEETYTIDRVGMIKNSEGVEINLDSILAEEVSIIEPETTSDELVVVLPMEGHTGITLRNLVNMLYSKQTLIQKAFELEAAIIDERFVTALNEVRIETVEDFKAAALGAGIDKALGIIFDFELGTIAFQFYKGELEPGKVKAYTDLAALINENAKTMKHASSKPTQTDNEKYTFRTWLLRLGMIGDEYKATRKMLLASLEGNGAFRRVAEENK